MSDVEQQDAPAQEVEEKGDELEQQFAAADAGQDPNADQPTIEDLASQLGWTPKDKYQGDPERWRPADEFLRQGHKSRKKLERTVEKLNGQMDTLARTSGAIMAEKLAEQHRDLAKRYEDAVERGDADEAWQTANQIGVVKKNIAEITAPPSALSADELDYTTEWSSKSPWLRDRAAYALAIEEADKWARRGASAQVQTQKAEEAVRRELPHLFQDGQQPAQVNGVNSRATTRTPRGTAYKDMPKEAQAMADDLLDRGLIANKEDYARNYFAQAAKGR